MNRRFRLLLLSLGGAHLLLIVAGALHFEWTGSGPLPRLLNAYGVASGTIFGYSFFAPAVNENVLVRFEVKMPDGKVLADKLEAGANREAAIRIGNIAEAFDGTDTKLRQALAASWAGTIFARHPGARSVTVIVESCDVPPMGEFLKGERPYWQRLYDATFVWPSSEESA